MNDLRYALRQLRASPSFTVIAVLTLGLGIGCTTGVFSVVDGVLLKPLRYADPARLVAIWPGRVLSRAEFAAIRDRVPSIEGTAGYTSPRGFTVAGPLEPMRIDGAYVTATFFQLLGARAVVGRAFVPGDDSPGRSRLVVLSHAFWRQTFGGDASVLGQSLSIDGVPHIIVGVMGPDFRYPLPGAQFWIPVELDPARAGDYWGYASLHGVGRLKPDARSAAARGEVLALAGRLRLENPLWTPGEEYTRGVDVVPLRSELGSGLKPTLLVLFGAVALVLLIACVNVANLLLARGVARRRELAVRTALGAGRSALVRQLLTEGVLLAVSGAALGLVVAVGAADLLLAVLPKDVPGLSEVAVDGRVLAFASGLVLFTSLLFGTLPALRASRLHVLRDALKEGGRGTPGPRRQRLARTLVAAESALAALLLLAGGLLIHSLANLLAVDPGFRTEHVLTARVSPPAGNYTEPARILSFYQAVLERLEGLPGVREVAASSDLPLHGLQGGMTAFAAEGDPHARNWRQGNLPVAFYTVVTPRYRSAMGIALYRGRDFLPTDRTGTPPVALISKSLAERCWRGEDAIGKRLGRPWSDEWWTVVGVVDDVKYENLASGSELAIYVPFAQHPTVTMTLVARLVTPPAAFVAALRPTVAGVDASVPVSDIQTTAQLVSEAAGPSRSAALVLGLFALLALALASVGMYGVLSQVVAQRTHEIGVRMALGAHVGDVVSMVLGEGAALAMVGASIGVAGGVAATRLLRGFLFGVSTLDPWTFAGVPALLILVAVAAAYLPARRAARVDPMVALRYE